MPISHKDMKDSIRIIPNLVNSEKFAENFKSLPQPIKINLANYINLWIDNTLNHTYYPKDKPEVFIREFPEKNLIELYVPSGKAFDIHYYFDFTGFNAEFTAKFKDYRYNENHF